MSETMLPEGFSTASAIARIKPKNTEKPDLGLLVASEACPAHALYTQNALVGAHIPVCREHLERTQGKVRAVLVNSGNANCATGEAGIEDARAVCRELARLLGCAAQEVLFVSTGVIGARLPMDRLLGALPALTKSLAPASLDIFARAIMTTDTFPKARGRREQTFSVAGAAKGAGMIHPDMATMLGFLLTDARLEGLRELSARVATRSFNRVTVDGDTSPNDTLVVWTSAKRSASAAAIEEALTHVGQELSRLIARDGEGATRRITVEVRGARTEEEAVLAGKTIATSPLVKTAVHGRDPNWGRILAAAGRSGVAVDVKAAKVWIGPADLYSGGSPHPEHEPAAHRHLIEHEEVTLGIDLAAGAASADIWTCDFSPDYVRINADYRS